MGNQPLLWGDFGSTARFLGVTYSSENFIFFRGFMIDTQKNNSTITNTSVITCAISKTRYKLVKKPPEKFIKSLQLDLFSQFVTNDQSQVSNTIELWERIPKYFFTAKQVEKLRTIDGLAEPYEWAYTENGNEFTVSIQPALIKQKDGKYNGECSEKYKNIK